MRRSNLLLAAALVVTGAATGLNVVLWSAFVDSSDNASNLHGELETTRERLRQSQADVARLRPDHPPASVFERKVFPAPIPESFPSEVPSG